MPAALPRRVEGQDLPLPQHAGRVHVLGVQLPAHQDPLRLVKEGRVPGPPADRQAARFHLVHVPAALAAAEGGHFFCLLRQDGDGEIIVGLHKLIGISLGPHVDCADRQVPQPAQLAPADGHGVQAGLVSGSQQRGLPSENMQDLRRQTAPTPQDAASCKRSFRFIDTIQYMRFCRKSK